MSFGFGGMPQPITPQARPTAVQKTAPVVNRAAKQAGQRVAPPKPVVAPKPGAGPVAAKPGAPARRTQLPQQTGRPGQPGQIVPPPVPPPSPLPPPWWAEPGPEPMPPFFGGNPIWNPYLPEIPENRMPIDFPTDPGYGVLFDPSLLPTPDHDPIPISYGDRNSYGLFNAPTQLDQLGSTSNPQGAYQNTSLNGANNLYQPNFRLGLGPNMVMGANNMGTPVTGIPQYNVGGPVAPPPMPQPFQMQYPNFQTDPGTAQYVTQASTVQPPTGFGGRG